MDKKGFTLIELLGVLVIMAILMAVVITPIIGQINNTAKKLDSASLKVLYASTTSYLDENANLYAKDDGMIYYISVGQLIDSDNLASNYLSSFSESVLSRNNVIKVTVSDGGYQYSLADSGDNLSTLYTAYENANNDSVYNFMDGTYYAGSVSNNYVYYSGFMWRIMGINEDGSIKLITDEQVTTLNFGNGNSYENSYIYEWLNDYFLSRLKYSDFIVKQKSCYTSAAASTATGDVCAELEESSSNYKKTSLLSLYEYNMSILNSSTYLNSSSVFSTLTYSSSNTSQLFKVVADGSVSAANVNSMHYIRPIINVMPEATITSGTGTQASPYILFKSSASIVEADNRKLNSLNLAAGEYISLNSKIYRVIENDNTEVKIILNDLYEVTGSDYSSIFGTNSTYVVSAGLANYLNDTLKSTEYQSLNGVVSTKIWYQGDATSTSLYYKNSSLSKTNIIYNATVGLPKIGELLTVPIYQLSTSEFWTISMGSSSTIYTVSSSESTIKDVATSAYVRPVIILDASALIQSGTGTKASPYIVKY